MTDTPKPLANQCNDCGATLFADAKCPACGSANIEPMSRRRKVRR